MKKFFKTFVADVIAVVVAESIIISIFHRRTIFMDGLDNINWLFMLKWLAVILVFIGLWHFLNIVNNKNIIKPIIDAKLKNLTKDQLHLFISIGFSDNIDLKRSNINSDRETDNFKILERLGLVKIKTMDSSHISFNRTDECQDIFDNIFNWIYSEINKDTPPR